VPLWSDRRISGVDNSREDQMFGGSVLGPLAFRSLDLSRNKLGHDRADDTSGDLILQLKHVLGLAVEVVGPQVLLGIGLDQLG
jgi:hypothetical protein